MVYLPPTKQESKTFFYSFPLCDVYTAVYMLQSICCIYYIYLYYLIYLSNLTMGVRCTICGKDCQNEHTLAVHTAFKHSKPNVPLTNAINDISVKQNIPFVTSEAIERKRQELELIKLTAEIDKIKKPDTSIDYYGQMLQLQKEHNQMIMQMQKESFETKLALERMKIESELTQPDNNDFLSMIIPYLPQILQGITNKKPVDSPSPMKVDSTTEHPQSIEPVQQKGDDEMTTPEIKAYVEKIRKGEVTEQQAYNDFNEIMPQFKDKVNSMQFSWIFNQLKKSK